MGKNQHLRKADLNGLVVTVHKVLVVQKKMLLLIQQVGPLERELLQVEMIIQALKLNYYVLLVVYRPLLVLRMFCQ